MLTEQTSVVIVESQPVMRTVLTTILSSEGMTVLAALANSSDALQVASTLTPNLILFSVNDLNLQDLNRIVALRSEVSSARIIALITGEFHGQFQTVLDHGAHLVLTKSTQRSDLLHAIKNVAHKGIYPASMQVN